MSDAIRDAEVALEEIDEIAKNLESAGFQSAPGEEFSHREGFSHREEFSRREEYSPRQAMSNREAMSSRMPPMRPTPLPKRPKGRLLVGAMVIIVGVVAAYQGFAFLRYSAYGTVVGRVIDVSAPFESAVRFVHVREGESVDQGQLLMTLENVELEHRLREVQDELRVVQATLSADMSRIRWNADERFDRGQRASADYFSSWGELLREQALLAQLNRDLDRAERLKERKSISQEEYDEAYFAAIGQRDKVTKLNVALEELKSLWRLQEHSADDGYDQLEPTLARIQMLQGKATRLREQLDQGQVRAPVSGIVAKRHCFAGERAEASQPLFSILEQGSLHIVMYMPQDSSEQLREDDDIEVVIEPHAERVTCRMVRRGDAYEFAPNHIARYYRKDEMLLPVYIQPKDNQLSSLALRVGCVAKLPYALPQDIPGRNP